MTAESLSSLASTLRDLTAEAEALSLDLKHTHTETVGGTQVPQARSTGAADRLGSKQIIADCSHGHSQQEVRCSGNSSTVSALEARATATVEGDTLLQVLLKPFCCSAFNVTLKAVVLFPSEVVPEATDGCPARKKPKKGICDGVTNGAIHVITCCSISNEFSCIAFAELRALDFSRYQQRYVAMEVMYIGWGYLGLASQPTEPKTIEV